MSRGLVDIVSNVLKSVKIKQDEDKYNYSTSRYDVIRHTSANEYIEPSMSVDYVNIKRNKHHGVVIHSKDDININMSRHITTHIHGDVHVHIDSMTCNHAGFNGYGLGLSYSEYSKSDRISDRNDARDEIYRDSLQRFYRYNMFNT